jgi:hypothetical protein
MYLYTNFEGPTGAALTARELGIGDNRHRIGRGRSSSDVIVC